MPDMHVMADRSPCQESFIESVGCKLATPCSANTGEGEDKVDYTLLGRGGACKGGKQISASDKTTLKGRFGFELGFGRVTLGQTICLGIICH